MKFAALALAMVWMTLPGTSGASEFMSTGPGQTTILPNPGEDCFGIYTYNHDGTFENGYCWLYGGIVPPYYGALAEGFSNVGNLISCVTIYFTTTGGGIGLPIDLYFWAGGIDSPPGEVLLVCPDLVPENVPYWPDIGENVFELYGPSAGGSITVGYWDDFYSGGFFVAADEDGPGGHPWTNIAPGIGYPTGWQPANTIWRDCQSLGIGIHQILFSPIESSTWGEIKALYQMR